MPGPGRHWGEEGGPEGDLNDGESDDDDEDEAQRGVPRWGSCGTWLPASHQALRMPSCSCQAAQHATPLPGSLTCSMYHPGLCAVHCGLPPVPCCPAAEELAVHFCDVMQLPSPQDRCC